MAKSNFEKVKLLTPTGRVSFPHLKKPQKNDQGEDIWSIVLLVPKTADVTNFKTEMTRLAKDAFPGYKGKLTLAMKDGDTAVGDDGILKKEKYPEYAGCWVFTANSKNPVRCIGADKADIDPSDVYAGCYARLVVQAQAFDYKKKGVKLWLNGVQKHRDGAPLGGGGFSRDDFDELEVDDQAPDAYGETDDAMFG